MLEQNPRIPQILAPPAKPPSRERQQFIALLVLLMLMSIIIGALYLAQATTNVGNARDIQQLREERARLLREIEGLRAENAELYGVARLEQRAAELGFVTAAPDDIQYVVVEGYIYAEVDAPPTPQLATAAPPIYEENFAGWLRRQLDTLRQQFEDWGQEAD